MDVVTWVTACAVGVQAGLFVPLGAPETCDAVSAASAARAPGFGVTALDRWTPHVVAAAREFGVPAAWLRQVMRLESGGVAGATSPAGAMGLMQLMPGTYAELAARYRLGDDPYAPAANVAAGAAYLREMLDRFGVPGAFAAYNAGPGRLSDHLARGRALPAETQRYVARLIDALGDTAATIGQPPDSAAIDAPAAMGLHDGSGVSALSSRGGDGGAVIRARRDGIVTARSSALFAPRGSSAVAPAVSGFAQPMFESDARALSAGVIAGVRRDALFVPLGSGAARMGSSPEVR